MTTEQRDASAILKARLEQIGRGIGSDDKAVRDRAFEMLLAYLDLMGRLGVLRTFFADRPQLLDQLRGVLEKSLQRLRRIKAENPELSTLTLPEAARRLERRTRKTRQGAS
jgi:hypothetical protein